jgi:hypothetical protein
LNKFVFDANVVIGFHSIHYLDIILKKLEELSDKVYMAEKKCERSFRICTEEIINE